MPDSKLQIERTKSMPKVEFDVENKHFEIKGRSFASDSANFYENIIEWMKENLKDERITLEMELDYFNTPSHKQLLNLFNNLKQLNPESKVLWKYYEDDEEMLEVGKNMEHISKLNFDFLLVDED